MFTIPNELIINSNEGKFMPVGASTGVRFAAIEGSALDDPEKPDEALVGKLTEDAGEARLSEGMLIVDGGVSVKATDITDWGYTEYAEPVMAEANLADPTSITASLKSSEIIRLNFWLTEVGRTSAMISNAYMKKTRPYMYEVSGKTTWSEVYAALAEEIERDLKSYDLPLVSVSYTEAAGLTIKALDPYVRFAAQYGDVLAKDDKALSLEKVIVDEAGYEENEVVVAGPVNKVGSEGAGTVAQLIKNLRVPTSATIDPFHGDHGGMPVPGGKYYQFYVTVETSREDGNAHGVFSQAAVSRMQYNFFVNNAVSGLVDAFKKALNACYKKEEDGE